MSATTIAPAGEAWAAAFTEASNGDPEIQAHGRYFTCSYLLDGTERSYVIEVESGRVTSVTVDPGPLDVPYQFAIRAGVETWRGFGEKVRHPCSTASGRPSSSGTCGSRATFSCSCRTCAASRGRSSCCAPSARPSRPKGHNHEQQQDLPGHRALRHGRRRRPGQYKVFYLENGPGQPLVCQHTAGCHNHQWRGLLEDEEITRNYRVIAYDLPRHGKSDPPHNTEWWTEEYQLTADHYANFIVAFCDALELEDPIFMGSSFGGNIALQLALRRPTGSRASSRSRAPTTPPGSTWTGGSTLTPTPRRCAPAASGT